ncbi:MAG: sulfatase-like hydrolase/transferase [Deltaproteobacteria bacterium]|nr:sulfatase-like hydrolase/transferase [Deltaproteobacteria bacterium]
MPPLIALTLMVACGDAEITLPPGGARPDVILISIDTLRADHVGAYGYDRPTTPTLDALAARGARFTQARSPSPWTLPTHTTMLTGRLPLEHGVVDDGARLSPGQPHPAGRLGRGGLGDRGRRLKPLRERALRL